MNSILAEPPKFDLLTAHFLGSYHHYGDALFRCFMELRPFRQTLAAHFHFELYASGEYSRRLEQQCGDVAPGS